MEGATWSSLTRLTLAGAGKLLTFTFVSVLPAKTAGSTGTNGEFIYFCLNVAHLLAESDLHENWTQLQTGETKFYRQ